MVDVRQVKIYGPLADIQASGYFFITQATGQELEHLLLTSGQGLIEIPPATLPAKARKESARELGLNQDFATGHRAYSLGKFVGSNVLEHIAICTCTKGLVEVFLALLSGEQQNAGIKIKLFDLLERFHTLPIGQVGVHEYNLGSQFERFTDGLEAIGSFTDYFQVGITCQQMGQTCTRYSLVVYNQDMDMGSKRIGGDGNGRRGKGLRSCWCSIRDVCLYLRALFYIRGDVEQTAEVIKAVTQIAIGMQ